MNRVRTSRRRASATLTVVALSALLLASCSSADERDSEPPEERSFETVDETARLAQACADVINERDHDTFSAGRDAALELVMAAVEDDPPSHSEAETLTEQISALQSIFGAEREQLAEVSEEPG